MSVRKSAARSAAPSGAGLLKSLGFWALLAGASFIVGLFILSPLINKANESSRSAAPAASSNGPAPAPTPTAGLNTGASTRDGRRASTRRGTDADVQITPDAPTDGAVQKPSAVDDPAQAEYRERRAQIERSLGDSGSTGRSATDSAATDRPTDAPGQANGAQDAESPDRAARGDTAADSAAADTRPRRRHRGRRDAGDAPPPRPDTPDVTTAPPAPATGGTDVQKGDTIDR